VIIDIIYVECVNPAKPTNIAYRLSDSHATVNESERDGRLRSKNAVAAGGAIPFQGNDKSNSFQDPQVKMICDSEAGGFI
jgi:hypothetical protein